MSRKCVVWKRDEGTAWQWEAVSEPMGEREAVREAAELRLLGYSAKALPLGTKPKPEPEKAK